MPVVKLTQELIDSGELKCPPTKLRIEFCDSTQPGLYVLINSGGNVRSYFLRFRSPDNGKTTHVKLGRTTDIDLNEARRRAKTLKAEITLGKDPRADEKARKAIVTLDVFFQTQYLSHSKVHNRGWLKKSQMYNSKIKEAFGHKRLNQIKRHEISSWHVSLREDGLSPAYADRFLALLRHALNMAVEWEMLEKNPAARVKLFNIDNRVENYLNEDELKRLLKVLQTDRRSPVPSLIAMYLLATAVRLNTALQCKWRDIDRTARLMHVPAANSKSKKVHSVPLNNTAITVLDQLDTEGKYEYLFINRKTGKPYTTIHKAWERLRTEAGLPNLRIHDLRHSAASYMAQAGVSLYVIQQVLSHSDPSMTQRYAHLSTKNLQDAADRTSEFIEKVQKTM